MRVPHVADHQFCVHFLFSGDNKRLTAKLLKTLMKEHQAPNSRSPIPELSGFFKRLGCATNRRIGDSNSWRLRHFKTPRAQHGPSMGRVPAYTERWITSSVARSKWNCQRVAPKSYVEPTGDLAAARNSSAATTYCTVFAGPAVPLLA